MRILLFLCTLSLAACSLPKVSAKQDWIKSISSFSFVPLYPMREDVFVGDIRIHRIDGDNRGLHSRPLDRLESVQKSLATWDKGAPTYPPSGSTALTSGVTIPWNQPVAEGNIHQTTKETNRLRLMALPKIDVTRITNANAQASGLIGLWNSVIGVTYNGTDVLRVALTGLETVELPDRFVALEFQTKVADMLRDQNQRAAICVAAKSMGDPRFTGTAISIVTRVGYARGIEYTRSTNRTTTVNGDTTSVGTDPSNVQINEATTTIDAAQTLHETFPRPMAFGVDAIMIDPALLADTLFGKSRRGAGRTLAEKCEKEVGSFIMSPFAPTLTGAPKKK